MKDILTLAYKKNILLHVICILILFFHSALILNLIIYTTNVNSYKSIIQVTNPQEYYYFSFESNISEDFYGNLEALSKIYPEAQFGYTLAGDVLTEDGVKVRAVYLNPVIWEIQYELRKGDWFSTKSGTEIIIGKKLGSQFDIGDQLIFKSGQDRQCPETVTGYLKTDYIIDFSVSSDELTIPLLLNRTDNLCLTNDINLLRDAEVQYPQLGIIVRMPGKYPAEQLNNGILSSFQSIYQNTEQLYFSSIGSYGCLQLFLAISSVMSIIILCNYSIDNSTGFISISFICGMKRGKIVLLKVIEMLIDVMLSFLVTAIWKCIVSDPDTTAMFINEYIKNFIIFCTIFSVSIVTLYGAIINIRFKRILGDI